MGYILPVKFYTDIIHKTVTDKNYSSSSSVSSTISVELRCDRGIFLMPMIFLKFEAGRLAVTDVSEVSIYLEFFAGLKPMILIDVVEKTDSDPSSLFSIVHLMKKSAIPAHR